ncbi:uncharacterized protein I206_102596 [Kwoniella pini CBS 10737]|uniref:Uncharacterized protein n=1 Tax=Kwoniella pini CBS 10737 TaxID=1296096 RepID=A0A1B9I5T5_9TREE|nr:uncharacterized protein I206_02950 [Kwoniella pini CBS 10737]OCF50890.1 hypothetical protein I206_02950 [Kwoniella pini CBS 10737]
MPSPPLSIVQSLSPRIAVLTSQDVVQSCEANGCRGLEELLRPWEGGTERVSILSSTLSPTIHPTFPVRFVSFESVYTNPILSVPNPDVTVDLISGFVGAKNPDDEQHYPITRSLLLSSRPLASHETFNHPVGVLFAVSTATPDPLGTLNKLHAQQISSAAQNVPWMDGQTVLRFFVVVHDVSMMGGDMAPAHELLANVKKAYGPHSTLLVINSQLEHREPPQSPDVSTHPSIPLPRPFTPEQSNPSALSQVYASALSSLTLSPMAAASASLGEKAVSDTPFSPSRPVRRKLYGHKLTAEDTQRLAALVREIVVQSLIPWMEARIREWNEVYHSNRRGITGRLFGAGRKFFGSRPNSPSPGTTPTGYNTIKGYYPIIAVEALSRRLADFAFMLRDYKFAGGVYDSLRKDFAQDRAWRYSAAATEMYGLCLLLSHPFFLPSSPPTMKPIPFTNLQHTEITSWLEQAITAYHQHSPITQIQLDALRITVLYYEAWKAIGEWRSVGYALVKGSGDSDEVPSAVMIEEAAAADVKGGKTQKGNRRRAFHLVLAARRYETAGLKTYSRRCLERASQIYRDSPWTSAQDRIEYSLGRQAYTLGQSDVAVEHFLRLLRREDTGVPGSQGGPLQDMAQAYEQLASRPDLLAKSSSKLQLPTPVFDVSQTRILPTSEASSSALSRERWADLENQAFTTWDRKGKKPMSLLADEKRLIVGVDEPLQVELIATNPLNAPLTLNNITLAFDHTDKVSTENIESVSLEPYETRMIHISVTPLSPSTIRLKDVSFSFHGFFPCTQSLVKRGKRLHSTKAQRITPTYAEDTSLTVDVTASRAILTAHLAGIPDNLFEGSVVGGRIRLSNRGKTNINDIGMIWNEYGVIRRTDDTKHQDTNNSIPNLIQPNTILPLYNGIIQPGEEREIPITFLATQTGSIDILGLVVFSSADDGASNTSSALICHQIDVRPILQINAVLRPTGQEAGHYTSVVEITNRSSVSIVINRIAGMSPSWMVESIESDHSLLPNQTLRSLLSIKYETSSKHDLRQTAVIDSLGKLVKGQPIAEVSTDLQNGISLTGNGGTEEALDSYLILKRQTRLKDLKQAFTTIDAKDIERLFQLIEPLSLDLVVTFSINDPIADSGFSRKGHSIISLNPSPTFSLVEDLQKEINATILSGNKSQRTMYEETSRLHRVLIDDVLNGYLANEIDPVQVKIKCGNKGKVFGNFGNGSFKIPITFEIINQSPILPIRYILNLPKPSLSDNINTNLSTPHYIDSLIHKGQLKALDYEEIHIEIWVHEPSLLDLGGWELLVETGELLNDDWAPRNTWSRIGSERMLEVMSKE